MVRRRPVNRLTLYKVGDHGRRLGDVQYAIIDMLYKVQLPIERKEVIRIISNELECTRAGVRSAISSLLMYEYIVADETHITAVQMEIRRSLEQR